MVKSGKYWIKNVGCQNMSHISTDWNSADNTTLLLKEPKYVVKE